MIEQAITGKQNLEMTYLKANDTKSKHGIIPLAAGEEDYQGKNSPACGSTAPNARKNLCSMLPVFWN